MGSKKAVRRRGLPDRWWIGQGAMHLRFVVTVDGLLVPHVVCYDITKGYVVALELNDAGEKFVRSSRGLGLPDNGYQRTARDPDGVYRHQYPTELARYVVRGTVNVAELGDGEHARGNAALTQQRALERLVSFVRIGDCVYGDLAQGWPMPAAAAGPSGTPGGAGNARDRQFASDEDSGK